MTKPRQTNLFHSVAEADTSRQMNVRIPGELYEALRSHLGTGPHGCVSNGKLAPFVVSALQRELARQTRKLKVVK